MITYIETEHDAGRARRQLDDAWDAFRDAAEDAYEAHCQDKDYKSSVHTDEIAEPLRTIKALQEELIRYHERCDVAINTEDEDHECDNDCAKECEQDELAEMQYQDWKDWR